MFLSLNWAILRWTSRQFSGVYLLWLFRMIDCFKLGWFLSKASPWGCFVGSPNPFVRMSTCFSWGWFGSPAGCGWPHFGGWVHFSVGPCTGGSVVHFGGVLCTLEGKGESGVSLAIFLFFGRRVCCWRCFLFVCFRRFFFGRIWFVERKLKCFAFRVLGLFVKIQGILGGCCICIRSVVLRLLSSGFWSIREVPSFVP